MGAPPQPLLMSLDLKGMVLETKDSCKPSGSLWRKVLEPKVKRRLQRRRQRILMKRRAHLPDSRRPTSGIQRRVRTLKKLVPNGDSMGLDGLFRETADYILSLQMRVEVMQIMVKVLSDSDKWAISLVKADIIFFLFFFLSFFFSCWIQCDISEVGFGSSEICIHVVQILTKVWSFFLLLFCVCVCVEKWLDAHKWVLGIHFLFSLLLAFYLHIHPRHKEKNWRKCCWNYIFI